jgi:deoxycytidylate deaminase
MDLPRAGKRVSCRLRVGLKRMVQCCRMSLTIKVASSVVNECLCLHAEENALLEAGRERVGEDAILYCNT